MSQGAHCKASTVMFRVTNRTAMHVASVQAHEHVLSARASRVPTQGPPTMPPLLHYSTFV